MINREIADINRRLDELYKRIGNMPVHIPTADNPIPMFLGAITGVNEIIGMDNRWEYEFKQATKTTPGFGIGKWAEVDGGISGIFYNMIEIRNSSSGLLGINISVEDLSDEQCPYELLPLATNIVVPIWTLRFGPTVEYWACVTNSVNKIGGW